jgi:hypothetical protein
MTQLARESALPLLNVFEVVTDGVSRHLVCFLDPVLAGARGIDGREIVGEFRPGPNREFDPATFVANPGFIEALTRYMNDEVASTDALRAEAGRYSGGTIHVLDPRSRAAQGEEPSADDVLGGFEVDAAGGIVPGSFRYNGEHLWFNPKTGISGVLADRRFYDWLHPLAGPAADQRAEG